MYRTPVVQDSHDVMLQELEEHLKAPPDVMSDGTSSTAEDDSYKIQALSQALKQMQFELSKRDKKIEQMEKMLASKTDAPASAAGAAVDRPPTLEEEEAEEEVTEKKTSEARRQQLRRLCIRKANGKLKVPEHIHRDYMAGGAARDKLMRVFIDSECKKVRAYM